MPASSTCAPQSLMRTCVRMLDRTSEAEDAVWAASILHADLDSFYASVEQRDDPSLRGQPGGGWWRGGAGCQLRSETVRCAHGHVGVGAARRLCPDLIVVPARFEAYSASESGRLRRVRRHVADRGGHLDRRSVPRRVGHATHRRVARRRSQRTCVVESRRRRPSDHGRCGPHEVPREGGERCRQARRSPACRPARRTRLPASAPGAEAVGRRRRSLHGKLEDRGIRTVGEVAELDQASLVSIVGKAAGRQLHALAHNVDARRVTTGTRRGSIGSQQALGRGRRSLRELEVILMGIVDRVTRRMRRADRSGTDGDAALQVRRLHAGDPFVVVPAGHVSDRVRFTRLRRRCCTSSGR